MKKNYKHNRLPKLFIKKANFSVMLFAMMAFSTARAYSQQSYTFTNCGATGQNGPTQAQVNVGYTGTNLNNAVTVTTLGIQQWVVPSTGSYRIDAFGAQGGVTWGLGARMSGDFTLTAGSTIRIVVGQQGGSTNSSHGSGGGGSFVVDNLNNPLIVAGGGGGRGASSGALQTTSNGSTLTAGQTPPGGGPGGTGGGGGASASGTSGGTSTTPGANAGGSTWASGGGGFLTNGGLYNSNSSQGGRSFLNGALGGDAATGANSQGGFGGGGGAGDRGAGGGGYSGGGGATSNSDGGGGGGSFNAGINQINGDGINAGNGRVIITALCDVSINGPTSICAGGSTTLNSTAVSNYSWSTGSTSQSIVVTPSVTTSYTVSGTGSINNCSSNIIITVVVNPLPTITGAVQLPVIPSTSAASVLCVGSQATLTAFGALTYTWASGPATTTRTASPLVTTSYTVSGTSTVGCINTGFVTVNVNTLNVSASSATVCLGSPAVLNASGGNPNIAAPYNWINAGQFQTITVSNLAATTVYTVTGIDNNFCTTSATAAVVVNPLPNVTVSADKTTICAGEKVNLTASGAQSYSWTPANTGAAISATLLVDVPTPFSVVGTDNNGCKKSAAVTINVVRCTGVNALQLANANISVYPNPSNGYFTIKSDVALTLTISNELGQVVKAVSLNEGNKNEVNINNLATGIYFIKGENNGYRINQKILITQ